MAGELDSASDSELVAFEYAYSYGGRPLKVFSVYWPPEGREATLGRQGT